MRISANAGATADEGSARLMAALFRRENRPCLCQPTKELTAVVLSALKGLKPKEATVITSRFGLDGSGAKTLEKVGQRLGVTRERIRQIQVKALHRLRHPARSRQLRVYLTSGEKAA